MSAPLHVSLIALVLVNLWFVAITDVAARSGLVLMAGAALISPWLGRWAGRRWYHLCWNAVVISGFFLLLRHVLQGGIHHMLEDGLRLAALCQVHLVSTLHRGQRRDLLFFNSFLIPIVTSFLCFDLPFSLALLVYAPTLCIALQLNVIESRRGEVRRWGRAVGQGFARGGLILAATALAFFFVPRDFEHKGLMKGELEWGKAQRLLEVDFEEDIQLGRKGEVRVDDRVVFEVRPTTPGGPLPEYWRGATNDRFTGSAWVSTGRVVPAWRWSEAGRGVLRRGWAEVEGEVQVTPRGPMKRAFVPLAAVELRAGEDAIRPYPDATLAFARRGGSYVLGLAGGREAPGAVDRRVHGPLFEIIEGTVSPGALERIDELTEGLEASDEVDQVAETLRSRLRGRHEYLMPGDEAAAADLEEFLGEGGAGHCEWFATALALALRRLEVPCRVVTGYRSDEVDEHGSLVVRRRHAHAWVEYFHPRQGWGVVDATPAGSMAASAQGSDWWGATWRTMEGWWIAITGFDDSVRVDLFESCRLGLTRLLRDLKAQLAMLGLLMLWGAMIADRRRRRHPACVRELRRAARRAGTVWHAHETGRELLQRVLRSSAEPARVEAVQLAVQRLERDRYALS